jgi:hypothetical protein
VRRDGQPANAEFADKDNNEINGAPINTSANADGERSP